MAKVQVAKVQGTDPETFEVLIVGAGFGGIGMAIALQRAGIGPFVVVEKSGDLGGTWRDNTYPGAACDVPSNLYSFSFRPGRWTRRYPRQSEILDYLHAVADEHGLEPHIRCGTGVAEAVFDEPGGRWRVRLDDGRVLWARVVVSAVGQLNRPARPELAGLDDFAGPAWHSARWDHGQPLEGKRVAVIGTGASAIQFVPEVAEVAAHVDVYQRSAPYVLPKPDRPYRRWEQALFDAVPIARKADRLRIFLYGELLTSGFVTSPKLLGAARARWWRLLHEQIPDPDLRHRCIPDHVMGCKRVLFSNDWYRTLARPHVDLITERIERVVPSGVVTAGGTTRPADVLIYGTGFQTLDFLAPMVVRGRGGRALHDVWRDGASAYLGVAVPGFPNLFLLYGPNTNLGGNSIIFMLESQIAYVTAAVAALDRRRLGWLDVRPEVHQDFEAWVDRASRASVWESGCRSWYTTASGRNTNNWPTYTVLYRQRLRRFDLGSYQVAPQRPGPGPARPPVGAGGPVGSQAPPTGAEVGPAAAPTPAAAR